MSIFWTLFLHDSKKMSEEKKCLDKEIQDSKSDVQEFEDDAKKTFLGQREEKKWLDGVGVDLTLAEKHLRTNTRTLELKEEAKNAGMNRIKDQFKILSKINEALLPMRENDDDGKKRSEEKKDILTKMEKHVLEVFEKCYDRVFNI